MKRKTLSCFLVLLVLIVWSHSAGAVDQNWKQDQEKNFAKIALKPGDVITAAEVGKVKDLMPFAFTEWVKKGEYVLNIAALKFDVSADQAWDQKCASNKGKYGLGPNKEIVKAGTNESPVYLDARPFAVIDTKNDPDVGIKIMHNFYSEVYRPGNYFTPAMISSIGPGGFEKQMQGDQYRYYYWSRDKEVPNPEKKIYSEVYEIMSPYDVAGTVQLTHRFIENEPDHFFIYVPAIRRVKKLSGANRSDPFFGTDLCIDDSKGWAGKNETMDYKYAGEKLMLVPYQNWQVEAPTQFNKMSDGTWEGPRGKEGQLLGCEVPDTKLAPWSPVNDVYVPRDCWVVEMQARDPYYLIGKQILYIDKKTNMIYYKIVYNKAGEYWKTLQNAYVITKWGDDNKQGCNSETRVCMVDDRSHHGTVSVVYGKQKRGMDIVAEYNTPKIDPSQCTPSAIQRRSK